MRSVAALPALALVAGAAAGLILPDPPLRLWPLGVILAAAAALAVWAWWTSRSAALVVAAGVGFASGGMLLGARAWQQAWRPTLRVVFDEHRVADAPVLAQLTGILRTDATVRAEGVSVSLEVRAAVFPDGDGARLRPLAGSRSQAVRGGVLLTVSGVIAAAQVEEWRAGRTIAVPARLRPPSRHLDPGVLDEERALARRGTTLVGSVKSGALVDVIACGDVWSEAAASARALVRRIVARHVGRWSATSAGLVTAILIGDRAGLDPDLERSLQEAGTYHVIAISGGNIAILAGLTLAAFRWADMGRSAMLTAVAAFLAYGSMVEGGVSVDRAVLTAVVYFLARAIDHRVEPLQGLSVAAGVLVAVDPLAVADPAFLLSFGATAGIIWVNPLVGPSRAPRFVAAAVSLVIASATAEVALLPVSAYFFGRVTLAGLLLNLAAIPLMGLAQVAGMVLLPVALLGPPWLADGCGFIAHLGAAALVLSGELVQYVAAATWRVARPSPQALGAYYIGGLAAWQARRWGRRQGSGMWPVWRAVSRGGTLVAVAAAVWIALEPWAIVAARGDGRLHVTFIDVGQGDAAFIRFPRGATMLVDAGGSASTAYDVGERVVGPVLREAGVRSGGTIAITHGDADHAGGAVSMVRELRPFDVWEGVPVPRLMLRQRLREVADAVGARWTTVQRNDALLVDDVRVSVLHPAVPDWERQQTRNDDSIVLELRWRDVSFVLAGDIGREVEQMIRPQLESAALRVLKVPHHGSLTSSSWPFVTQLAPTAAVFSAGRGNAFGHPAAEVVARYEAIGAEIFRTDRDGAVFFDTDGYSLNVRTFLGRTLLLPRKHETTKPGKAIDDQVGLTTGR